MNLNISPLTPLPIDSAGHPVPVFDPDTGQTQVIECTASDTVYSSLPFSTYDRERPYAILAGALGEDETVVPLLKFVYKGVIPPFGMSSTLTVDYAAGLDSPLLRYDGTNYTLLLHFDEGDMSLDETIGSIRTAVEDFFDVIVLVDSEGFSEPFHYSDEPIAFTPVNRGATPVIVRVLMNEDGFIGNYPESALEQASMPIMAGQCVELIVQPGHVLTAQSSEAGALCYMTPSKKY